MTSGAGRCGVCGAALPFSGRTHRRCVECAARESDTYRPPVYRGDKPPNFGVSVSAGLRLAHALKKKKESMRDG